MSDAMDNALRKLIADARAQAFEEAAEAAEGMDSRGTGGCDPHCEACIVARELAVHYRSDAKRAREG